MLHFKSTKASKDNVSNDLSTLSQPKESIKNARLSKLNIVLILFILACVNNLFDLVPWAHLHRKFNISDIGLLVLCGMFASIVLMRHTYILFDNGFSRLILLYLIFVIMQTSIVSFNFGQSIVDGFIAIRHQFYYLSFFVFLALFDKQEKIEQFIKIITLLAMILVILGLINNYVVTIYYHKWAEGHNIRSGIMRAYFSGMDIITLGLIWAVVNWAVKKRDRSKSTLAIFIFAFAHMLRQTRSRILAVALAIVFILYTKKKYKPLLFVTISFVLAAGVAEVIMKENILLMPFTSTVKDVSEGTGSVSGRLQQLEVDIQIFLEHPFLGSGSAALRVGEVGSVSASGLSMAGLSAIARKEDLGYAHWIKAYGIPGILWLLALFGLLYRYYRGLRHIHENSLEPVVLLATGYISFVLVSFLTLPHLIRSDQIILFCMMLAIMVQCFRFNRKARQNLSER